MNEKFLEQNSVYVINRLNVWFIDLCHIFIKSFPDCGNGELLIYGWEMLPV